jgi:flagellar biosynthesis protein FlhG
MGSIENRQNRPSPLGQGKNRLPQRPRIIAIAGGKGGVGKTVNATMLAMCLAYLDKRVVLVDADFYGPNLHMLFGLYRDSKSLVRYFEGTRPLSEFAVETSIPGLSVITSHVTNGSSRSPQFWQKQKWIRHLSKLDADYVILDLGPGTEYTHLDLFNIADDKLVVTTCENTSLYGAYQFVRSGLLRYLNRSSAVFDPDLNEKFQDVGDLMQGRRVWRIKQLWDHLESERGHWPFELEQAVRGYRPRLLINTLREHDRASQVQALRLALRDVLSVELNVAGKVRYDNGVRKAIQTGRVLSLMSIKGYASEDMLRIAHRSFIARELEESYNRLFSDAQDPVPGVASGVRLCTHRCVAWNFCDKRNGGTPCAVLHPELATSTAKVDDDHKEDDYWEFPADRLYAGSNS